jgi:dienelactone hydrolase
MRLHEKGMIVVLSARIFAAAVLVPVMSGSASAEDGLPERVTFPSADNTTTLLGYVFRPAHPGAAQVPAVVMMHGRAGAYSSAANGRYDASTLSQRHQMWGRLWAERGYIAILVDGFGPRGHPHGFPRFSYDSRPEELNEVTVRPLDAYGALAYLRSRPDVLPDRIALQGWSNGGSATLATVATDAPGLDDHTPVKGFRAAIAFYPACGLKDHFAATGYGSYTPLYVFMGTADEEVSPRVCRRLLGAAGGDVETKFYKGATHDFDDPGRRRQRVQANAEAREDVIPRATKFFDKYVAGKR